MESISKKELKEILIKNWMTHDSMWFYNCVKECGIEKTNKINKASVRSMAKIETKRLKELFNVNSIHSFKELKEFVERILDVVKADFMDFSYQFLSNNLFKFTMNKCFAYDGINRLGYIKKYDCGIFERIEGWFDELGIQYDVKPQVDGCMMFQRNECFRDFKFYFNKKTL